MEAHKGKFVVLFPLCLAFVLPSAASAATITVTVGGDASGCTLRNAIASANADADAGGCVATNLPYGNDTVQVPGSIASPIQLATVPLSVNGSGNDLTINGPGAAALDVRGGANFRVFNLTGSGTTTISNLTISHGNVVGNSQFGGAISVNQGNLTLDHVAVSQNTATATDTTGSATTGGGAISYSGSGTLTVRDSTVANNSATATGSGGGSFNFASVFSGAIVGFGPNNFQIERSTLNDNVATATASGTSPFGQAYGGAVMEPSGASSTVTIKSSTLSGNQAVGSGGGFGWGGALYTETGGGTLLRSDTITDNTGSKGGNVLNGQNTGQTTTFQNTIVSNPHGSANCANAGGGGTNVSGGFNLEDANTCGFNQSTDQVNVASTGLDPTLANNGGPTMTQALLSGSPAIDQGSSFGEALDQRGLGRPADFSGIPNASGGDGADIGAFELQQTCAGQSTPDAFCGPSGGGGGTGSGGIGGAGVASLASHSATLSGNRIPLEIRCNAGGASCDGTVVVNTTKPVGRAATVSVKKKVVKLGSASCSIPAGQSKTIKVKLSKQGRQLFEKVRKVKAKVTITTHGTSGSLAVSRTLTVHKKG